jgi:tetratricopeptide (TPR) repeat protein
VDAVTGHNPNPTIAIIKLGSNHPIVARILTVVCRLRYNTGDYYGAIEFLDRALILSCHAYGELIEVYNLLGNVSFEVGALAVALKAFQSGLRMQQNIGM